MKKIVSAFLIGALMTSCLSPIEENESMGSLISENEIQIEVSNISPGSNKIVMKNTTPGVGSFWDYIIGASSRQCDTVLLPFLGTQTITFTALSGGGAVKTTRDVTIDKIDFPLDPLWDLLAGDDADGKTWVWAADNPTGGLYGNGADDDGAPAWWVVGPDEMNTGYNSLYDEIVFDLNGGANFTLIQKGLDGKGSPKITKDSFILDVSKRTVKTANGTPFIMANGSAKDGLRIYEITEDVLTFIFTIDHDWGTEAYYWMFKRKGYSYP